jgi:hypothetical protein
LKLSLRGENLDFAPSLASAWALFPSVTFAVESR